MTANFKALFREPTMLFPCAAGVQIPQMGVEDAKIKPLRGKSLNSKLLPMKFIPQDVNPANDAYVKMVSSGLSFSEDVVEDRCMHMVPYDTKYFNNVFEPGELVTVPPRARSSMGRHNKIGTDVRHMPCYLKKTIKPKPLTPLRKQAKEKALLLHKQALIAESEGKSHITDGQSEVSSFFMTEPKDIKSFVPLESIPEAKGKSVASESDKIPKGKLKSVSKENDGKKREGKVVFSLERGSKSDDIAGSKTSREEPNTGTPRGDWDDHLMSRLSKLTANWIVHERMMPQEKTKDKLTKTLESWYGPPTHTDLVREEMSDGEEKEEGKQKKPKTKWKKKEASLLARVYNKTPPPVEALDPYSDDSKAPFYRQPAGIRKKKKTEEKEEAVRPSGSKNKEENWSINATAHNIHVRSRVTTPPVTLKDYMSPRVGDKIFETDNLFQQEWLTGKTQIYQFRGDEKRIHMDSENKYQKQLQRQMPEQPNVWYNIDKDANEKDVGKDSGSFMPHKGHKRWIDLPEPVDDTAGVMTAVPTEYNPVYPKAEDLSDKRKVKQNRVLSSVVHDWRNKWFMSGQFADSTPEDLIRDMADIQPHVRLKAIGTVAKAAEYKPPLDSSIQLDKSANDPVSELPEEIFVALDFLLDDTNNQVRKAAAITLYSLDRPSDKAKAELRLMLTGDNAVDRWAAAQCLAHYGECDSDVVAEVIKQILASESAVKHEQGIHLLSKLSNSSTLVHCMVAEQLNSSSWRHRVIACKMLPTLFGSINRDITQKLSELMWHDWHIEVRKAASQCLGKTSHGRDVHDDIKDRINNGTERTKMEAINKLGQLGIMTAKLLPAFLQCFSDPYVSIRCEICITCGNLQIKEEQVLNRLVHLATFDPIWKVKALAIQALGRIGVVNEDVKECLLWAMRYEERPGVRAEACHSLIALDIQDEDVIEIIQDRLLVESSQLVREEMIEGLSVFGFSTSEDMDTVAQIKAEVRKLCTRNIIASQIIVNENDDTKREQLKRLVCQTEQDIEALNEKKARILKRIRSQARSSDSLSSSPQPRTSTPLPRVKVMSNSTTPEPVSREGTVFTPTADKELEAILNQEEVESTSGSASASGKSRPVTEGSVELGQDIPEEGGEQLDRADSKPGGKIVNAIFITDTEDDKVRPVTGEEFKEQSNEHAVSSGRALSMKQQLDLPRSKDGLLSPLGSFVDMKSSRLSIAQFSEKRSLISRESLRERQRLNMEVNSVYADLNARYAGMIQHLMNIDNGLNTKGASAESSTVGSLSGSNGPSVNLINVMNDELIKGIIEEMTSTLERDTQNVMELHVKEDETGVETINGDEKQENLGETVPEDEAEAANDENEKTKESAGEWKSFTDTLSEDPYSHSRATSYPSYEDDPNIATTTNTTGITAHASEYGVDEGEEKALEKSHGIDGGEDADVLCLDLNKDA